MIFAIICAGGTGERMGAKMPKQFLLLDDKPILIYTLERFISCVEFDAYFLGMHPDWVEYTKELIEKYFKEQMDKIYVVTGGEDRNTTLMNVIGEIEKRFGNDDSHKIITHDAVRPFVTEDIIRANIDALKECDAVGTGVPSTDTIVESFDGESISSVPDRKNMYLIQTPQSFRMERLKDLYKSLDEKEKKTLTDACGIFVKKEEPVRMVNGAYTNIKITTQCDMITAAAMAKAFKNGKLQ